MPSAPAIPTQIGSPVVAGEERGGHRARRDHRADGDVHLSGDHQKSHRHRHDSEIGVEVDPARGSEKGSKVHAADDHEEGNHADEAEHGPGLGPAQEAGECVHGFALTSSSWRS
jgi:hypothetical protein